MRRVGVAFLAGDRGDVDDAAVILLDHRRHDRLAADEGPVEIDAQNLAPFLEVGFPYRLVDPGDAGIVDENVYFAERCERSVFCLFNRGQIRHVDLERRDAGADFLGSLVCKRLVMIPDRDFGAGTDKTLGNGAPKSLRAAGDNGAAAVQIDLVHGESPLAKNSPAPVGLPASRGRTPAPSPRSSREEGWCEGFSDPRVPRTSLAQC